MKIKIVGYFLFLATFSVHALVPVEGIVMGEAREEFQNDPLRRIFRDIYDRSQEGENSKIKLYISTYEGGEVLKDSCGHLVAPVYSTPWQEKQAKRNVAATLQYIGLDTSIKAIGAYARELEIDESDFKKLTTNLVRNYCSKNVTVFSLKTIEKSLQHYYSNPESNIIPNISTSPFATMAMKDAAGKPQSRSREFDLVIENFKAFCSWGGEVEDYRLLTPYLKNPYIMSFVFRNLAGVKNVMNERKNSVILVPSSDTVQVSCTDIICRKTSLDDFLIKFPRSTGSTGLATDLSRLYCHHMRYLDPPQNTVPELKTIIKAKELEDPIFETSQFISLMTGVPDLMSGVQSYQELPLLIRSSIDERWDLWAKNVLSTFSRDLHYEESLHVKISPRRDLAQLASKGFAINLNVTLGEMDRLIEENDKLKLTFDLKLSKNFIRSLKSKNALLENEVDVEGQQKLREEVGRYLDLQLREKEKLLTEKVWNENFGKLIADELIQQSKLYRGTMFSSYQDEVLRIPVSFYYGPFAMSYLRYRAQVRSKTIMEAP